MQITLADDDIDDFENFQIVLKQLKSTADLTYVKNGEELLESLATSIPDLLFMDDYMPCKDGKECIKEIRANSRFDELKIIIYTSLTFPSSVEYFFKHGANLFIEKPVSLKGLRNLLEKIFLRFEQDQLKDKTWETFTIAC